MFIIITCIVNAGLLSLFGRYNEKPTPPVNLAADFGGGGLMCALGIILALYERTKSGTGQIVDASMVEGTAYLGSWLFRSQKVPNLWGNLRGRNMYALSSVKNFAFFSEIYDYILSQFFLLYTTYTCYILFCRLDTGSHFYDTYETKDKFYMCVGALEPQFYEIFLEKLGFTSDEMPQYENFEENRNKLAEIFKGKTQAEWCAIFDGTDACVTPMLSIQNVASHSHNNQKQTFTVMDKNDVIPNPAPRLSRTPAVSVGTCKNPLPGENTIEILKIELKLQSDEIHNLLSNGVAYDQAQTTSKL